ncbi:RNA polymerase I-specific transcription initiation factor RRN3 [Lates japonicus]|uniref:RNA polymerase I-specific transcription initiation factor RRN3 n=1 Tax=Lates japonicus TaxID=270547 RepID=A0AAD3RKM2_LATJO|nr:RNA polymerase I-specific transcription initiation factor RRN3 [Lates japonicus]
MEIDGLDFMNSPPVKTVRFGGSVAETLAKYKQGDSSDYELLKHQLADPEIKDAQIISWLQEFRSCVTQLNKDHEQLIYTVLRLPWVGRSQAVVEEYMTFLSNLVSAQTVYLCACLKMVVSHFTPKRVTICEGGVDISDSDDEDENLPRNFDRCHQALQLITRYVPSIGDVAADQPSSARWPHPGHRRSWTHSIAVMAYIKGRPIRWRLCCWVPGSFLAGQVHPLPTVRACLDLLLSWIHRYIDSQDSSGKQACCDISLHGPFYSTCQAVFYTIVFRHRAMLEGNMKKGLEYLQSLNLERVVMCQMNPLKVCLPSVTSMFAAITTHTHTQM